MISCRANIFVCEKTPAVASASQPQTACAMAWVFVSGRMEIGEAGEDGVLGCYRGCVERLLVAWCGSQSVGDRGVKSCAFVNGVE